jgi:hypothetical protein
MKWQRGSSGGRGGGPRLEAAALMMVARRLYNGRGEPMARGSCAQDDDVVVRGVRGSAARGSVTVAVTVAVEAHTVHGSSTFIDLGVQL